MATELLERHYKDINIMEHYNLEEQIAFEREARINLENALEKFTADMSAAVINLNHEEMELLRSPALASFRKVLSFAKKTKPSLALRFLPSSINGSNPIYKSAHILKTPEMDFSSTSSWGNEPRQAHAELHTQTLPKALNAYAKLLSLQHINSDQEKLIFSCLGDAFLWKCQFMQRREMKPQPGSLHSRPERERGAEAAPSSAPAPQFAWRPSSDEDNARSRFAPIAPLISTEQREKERKRKREEQEKEERSRKREERKREERELNPADHNTLDKATVSAPRRVFFGDLLDGLRRDELCK